jgi:protein phosphatase
MASLPEGPEKPPPPVIKGRRKPSSYRGPVFRSYGLTHPGRVRPTNQDQFLIAELARALRVRRTSLPRTKMRLGDERGRLLVVADGVGGTRGGEEASALAVDTVEGFVLNALDWCTHPQGPEGLRVLAEFRAGLRRADARIYRKAARHPALQGMGTTLTLAYSIGWDMFVAHAGDSRCYLFRGRTLYQLTSDHTVVQDLVRQGYLQPAQAKGHRLANQITNVVGGPEPGVRPELHKLRLEPGDVVLLCTDGLTSMVPDHDIAQVLLREPEPRRACERLVDRANKKGGEDNITVVLARYGAPKVAPK